ncbi:unnamed protein product [Brachionus calyciflorus]|uniref:Uncharacterized protein n=1 Tax=Brachionus calyciflorus TaxID=104777 RepID=A0A814HDX5_9BILA|nr:unnamed protein product [Brachionus calyciflorus]
MFFDLIKYTISFLIAIVCFLLFLLSAWYLFWKLFLSRFDFIRELFSSNSNHNIQTASTTNTRSVLNTSRSRKD